jgi:uncharacterized membrane protein YfcA
VTPVEIIETIAVCVVIGSLIGSIGVGGILLLPWLTEIVGFGVREAVCIAMASYLATGAGAIVQARLSSDGNIVRDYWPLLVATLPGALLGAFAIAVVPDVLVLLVLAAFLALTGIWTLVKHRLPERAISAHRAGWPTGIGSGFASSITGTGGPAVMIPVLLWRGVPLLAAVALGQMVQLPIAAAATIGNVASGPFDYLAALIVGVALVPGVFLGRWLALRLPIDLITKIVAVVLVATGIVVAVRALQ